MTYLVGIDIGTSAMKATALTTEGKIAATCAAEYVLDMPREGICEADVAAYWTALVTCCRGIVSAGVAPGGIVALSLAAQAETLVCLDEKYEPLRPAIVWLDNRSVEEAKELREHFGQSALYAVSGQPEMIPMWPATKMLWLAHNEPATFEHTRWWVQLLDYFTYRLTGRLMSDRSEYSSSLVLDASSGEWYQPMLDYVGITTAQLPELGTAGSSVGLLMPKIASELGLSERTVVALGGFDQACTTLGAGNVSPGIVTESTGTCLAVHATLSHFQTVAGGVIPCHIHVAPSRWFYDASASTGGAVFKWFRDAFYPAGTSYSVLTSMAEEVAPGSTGLVMLPHLMGSVVPEYDADVRGVLAGLQLSHGRPHVARAILESIAYLLRHLVELQVEAGATCEEIRSIGGGARSDLWCQIKADVTGVPVVTMEVEEAGTLGAAILASVGAGVYGTVGEACARMVRVRRRFEPEASVREVYRDAYGRYRMIYPGLKGLWASESRSERAR